MLRKVMPLKLYGQRKTNKIEEQETELKIIVSMKKTGNRNNNNVLKPSFSGIRHNRYMLSALVFITTGLYLYIFDSHIFFFQENYTLFVFSEEYFHQFIVKPGGLVEYAGNFLAQGYFNNVYGATILALLFTLLAIIFLKINKKLFAEETVSLFFAALASALLFIMQMNFNWLMFNNIGLILVALFFLFSISSDRRNRRIIVLGLFPLFFYLTGAYSWIYLGMIVFYSLLSKEFIFPGSLFTTAAISVMAFKTFLSLQPYSGLLIYPLPIKESFTTPYYLYILYGFFIFYTILIKGFALIRIKEEYLKTLQTYGILAIFSLMVFIQSRLYDRKTIDFFKIEKAFVNQDWNGVIKLQEAIQSSNLVAQYYYNIALSEKNILCDRLFFSRQDFDTETIMIPWDSGININKIFRGVYFFYTIGLINEAHRWAFESMVVQGYRPENIRLLIKTELINGHYAIAGKYINILKNTLHYRSLAKKYETMLYHPERVESDPEFGAKLRLQPKTDFPVRIKSPQGNILLLLQSNNENRAAFEYKLAWFMLEKNIKGLTEEIQNLKKMGYTRIPRHIEEAALFSSANMGSVPDLGGLTISAESSQRFSEYESLLMSMQINKSRKNTVIPAKFLTTYWYYLDRN